MKSEGFSLAVKNLKAGETIRAPQWSPIDNCKLHLIDLMITLPTILITSVVFIEPPPKMVNVGFFSKFYFNFINRKWKILFKTKTNLRNYIESLVLFYKINKFNKT